MTQRGAARALAAVGRLLVGCGVVILLFAAYQLWGTGLAESRAQDKLAADFDARLAEASTTAAPTTSTTAPTSSVTSAAPPSSATTTVSPQLVDLLYPDNGEPLARIQIPRIGVDKVVVEGVDVEDLRKGPGHFPTTPLPGQAGNAAIAGHRTTYGAPFGDIDQLQVGDDIRVTTVLGDYLYKVAGQKIVYPEEVEVVGPFGDNRLTLSACHPKYSAEQRIIVWAILQGDPDPTVARPEDRRTIDVATTTTGASTPSGQSSATAAPTSTPTSSTSSTAEAVITTVDPAANQLAGDGGAWPGAIGWAATTMAAGVAAWFLAQRVDGDSTRARTWRLARRGGVYLLASPVVAVLLFLCFTYVDRLLPAL